MMRWLALTSATLAVATLAGCAALAAPANHAQMGAGPAQQEQGAIGEGPGADIAASLGYHGPVRPSRPRDGASD